MKLGIVVSLLVGLVGTASADVTVFMNRHGHVDDDNGAEIPAFGGGDRVWSATVACVKDTFAQFRVTVVDQRPASGSYITAVVGGRASLVGGDDASMNGVAPYSGRVIGDAVVYVFSQVGTGERDVANLCAVTAHEVGHAMGLDHTYLCGDVMSYFHDRCGKQTFVDRDAACGEYGKRACANGATAQNSFRLLGQLVGFRGTPAPSPGRTEDADGDDAIEPTPYDDDAADVDSGENDEPDLEDGSFEAAGGSDDSDGSDGSDDSDDSEDSEDTEGADASDATNRRQRGHHCGDTRVQHRDTTTTQAAPHVEQHVSYVRRGNVVYRITTVTIRR